MCVCVLFVEASGNFYNKFAINMVIIVITYLVVQHVYHTFYDIYNKYSNGRQYPFLEVKSALVIILRLIKCMYDGFSGTQITIKATCYLLFLIYFLFIHMVLLNT